MFCFVFYQSLAMEPKLASNLKSPCLNFLSAEIIGMYHQAQFSCFELRTA